MTESRRPLRSFTSQVADVATILIAVAGLAVAGTVVYDRLAAGSGPRDLDEDRVVDKLGTAGSIVQARRAAERVG